MSGPDKRVGCAVGIDDSDVRLGSTRIDGSDSARPECGATRGVDRSRRGALTAAWGPRIYIIAAQRHECAPECVLAARFSLGPARSRDYGALLRMCLQLCSSPDTAAWGPRVSARALWCGPQLCCGVVHRRHAVERCSWDAAGARAARAVSVVMRVGVGGCGCARARV